MSVKKKIKRFFRALRLWLIDGISGLVVPACYDSIWDLREKAVKRSRFSRFKKDLYYSYLKHHGSWIALRTRMEEPIVTPHGFFGIFISTNAVIGKRVVVMQQVTIGSNTTVGSSHNGAPVIEDDVFIGAGATIIGNVRVGHHSRIGANCIVVKDVPPNSVVVMRGMDTITKEKLMDNRWIDAVHQ